MITAKSSIEMESSIDFDKGVEHPEGWVYPKLGEILNVNYGKGLKEANRAPGNIPVYGSNGVVGQNNVPLTQGTTIIIGRKGTVGAVHFSTSPCWPIDTTYFIDSFNGLDPKYLLYSLRRLNLVERDTSTAIPGLNRDDLYDQQIPLPPLAEQKRIVAKVEDLLPRTHAARERLTKVQTILKRFRQSVLSAAYSGRLTADWRERNSTRETGQTLLKSILNEKRWDVSEDRSKYKENISSVNERLSALPDSWTWSAIRQLARNFDGQRIPVKADDRAKRKGPYPYYGASGIIDSLDGYLFDGDFLLIAEDGANLLSRSTPIAFHASGKFWVNNHAHIVQTYGGIPLRYLENYLNGIDLQYFVTGSAQPKLTQEAMNRISVPLPPLAEQYEIVRRVEALFKLADMIERRVAATTSRVAKLTQTILVKAFRGELVPTEAELARREGRSYEPASQLMARIRAEREIKGQSGHSGNSKNRPKTMLTKSIN